MPVGSDIDTVPTPGATRSGFAAQSMYVGPRELKPPIVSSARFGVPFVLDAPTVRTHGALPGRDDRAVLRLTGGVLALVAGSGDDHHSGVDDALGRERQRVGPVRLAHRRADRHVHDADVVLSVMREHPVERRDDVADRALAVGVENLEGDDARVGRDAGLLAVGIVSVAGDDARHVRAVAVVVVRSRLAVHEIDELGDALIAVRKLSGRADSSGRRATPRCLSR